MRDRGTVFAALVLRDGAVCYLCNESGWDSDDPFEIEHVKPRSAGGSDAMENLALAHRSCNQRKGTSPVTRA